MEISQRNEVKLVPLAPSSRWNGCISYHAALCSPNFSSRRILAQTLLSRLLPFPNMPPPERAFVETTDESFARGAYKFKRARVNRAVGAG